MTENTDKVIIWQCDLSSKSCYIYEIKIKNKLR
jgi:hypothetical protein